LWCGTEDYLIEENKTFTKELQALNIPHEGMFSEGDHSWPWWDKHIWDVLKFFLQETDR
jgi:S-formylglutathione hydrolase FrmB